MPLPWRIDEPARRKLDERLHRLAAARREVQAAQEDAEEYAGLLLQSEYGLLVGEKYTFPSEQNPSGYRGRIIKAEGFWTTEGVSLCLHVLIGENTIRIFPPNIPMGAGHL